MASRCLSVAPLLSERLRTSLELLGSGLERMNECSGLNPRMASSDRNLSVPVVRTGKTRCHTIQPFFAIPTPN